MSGREKYAPGAAFGAEVQKEGERWTLVLVRDLRHPPVKVWKALTEPEQLREWAPFDSDRNLGTVGTAKFSTVGAPTPHVAETQVKRAEEPRLLEFSWGDQDIRWELEPQGEGTRLTLWHNINRKFISMGAAGWHICIDVLDALLAEQPLGRLVGADAMKFGDWQRLNAEYAKQFGVEAPSWPNPPKR
ncbi:MULTISPECIES: SRPBCC family protein [Corallococcus]|uniref:SRPBCC family protein n=1 Tax=Corallococcus TaxID=83461 RepID=UPI00117E6B90|nr:MULTISPECIES: SRPBCC family protein [Corallococcus]NBD08330.1 polyketide cyclase [Corallococcus silvisoli]TSC34287.1 SRPBCC family protein [Corallococcus sp. Z5C101001]